MNPPFHRLLPILCSLCLLDSGSVWADGGAVRLMRQTASWRVTVFTSPTPLRTGPVDISVLIQDAKTGQPLLDVPVKVWAHPAEDPESLVGGDAMTEAATNKLFRAIVVDIQQPGRWDLTIEVGPEENQESLLVEVDIGAGLPNWFNLAAWIGWPVLAGGLFVIHRWLAKRRR